MKAGRQKQRAVRHWERKKQFCSKTAKKGSFQEGRKDLGRDPDGCKNLAGRQKEGSRKTLKRKNRRVAGQQEERRAGL